MEADLRFQVAGKQRPWTLAQIKAGLLEFYSENGRYPTATEVNLYRYLPAARSIERQFGGIVQLRRSLGLTGQDDFRSGEHRKGKALMVNARAHKSEKDIYTFLCNQFGREFVHREYFFNTDTRMRADFFIYDMQGNFCVDTFFPADRHSLAGCLNIKLKKYHSGQADYPVIFLSMNHEISQGVIDTLVGQKKNPLRAGERVMTWDSFRAFCDSRGKIEVKRMSQKR